MSHAVECQVCGHVGVTKSKGSMLVLIFLLVFFFPIGILYWLLNRKTKVCSSCSSSHVRLFKPEPSLISETKPKETVNQPKFNSSKLVSNDGLAYNAGHRTQLDENGIEQVNCQFCKELIRFDAIKCKHCGSMLSG
ncbi:hypothetical protein ACG9Y4_04525 [Acinetobacter guillouiae]|uniref:hypothetical protein n=1 Tax=Acinetobacter guillouiae TaxID=106649 RepID=UPI003AF5DC38